MNISRNWAGDERRGKIRATPPGATNHFAVTPTTWKPRNLPMELRDYNEWQSAMARRAIMCAEAMWWKCHRSLIADYLKAHGVAVIHIIDASKAEPHPFTSAARIVDGKLSYSRNQQEFLQALTISSSLS